MAGWTTGICKTNGIDLHYLRTGGDKPSVVLLHGLMLNGACWAPLARELEEDYDVVMPDARGHGNSHAPNLGYCYEDLAADQSLISPALELFWQTNWNGYGSISYDGEFGSGYNSNQFYVKIGYSF